MELRGMTDCIPLHEVSQYPHEREYLVPPFSKWAVDGVRKEDGIVCVALRWMGCAHSSNLERIMQERIEADNIVLSQSPDGRFPSQLAYSPSRGWKKHNSSMRMKRTSSSTSISRSVLVDELEVSSQPPDVGSSQARSVGFVWQGAAEVGAADESISAEPEAPSEALQVEDELDEVSTRDELTW
eukprot:Hpha_TRINITY_DN15633_c0_g2::TRINITY_DN15633_c0_g2_i1::g.100070::m.100070